MPNYEAGHVIDDVHAWQQLIIWPIVAPAPTLYESTLPTPYLYSGAELCLKLRLNFSYVYDFTNFIVENF